MRRAESAPGYATQLWILYGLAGGFVLFVLTRAPWQHKFLALTGVASFALAASEARRLGPAEIARKEPMIVTLAGGASFCVPVLLFAFPFSGASAVAMVLGVLCIQGLWAIHRFPARPDARMEQRASLLAGVREGAVGGLFIAAFFSVLAAVIVLIASFAEGSGIFGGLARVVAAYVAGGVCAGGIYGVLRPLAAFPLGLVLIGVLGGTAVYGFMGAVISSVDPEHAAMGARAQLALAVALGVFVGVPAALGAGRS